jgi:hypothetical protein
VTTVGTLGSAGRALVDPRGHIAAVGEGWSLDWWIGADDRWHVAAREAAVRQQAVDAVPVLETSMRIPNGNAVQRVYGVAGAAGLVVLDLQNRSPGAVAAAFVLRGRPERSIRSVALEGTTLVIDGRPALVVPFAPSRWLVARAGDPDAFDTVVAGGAVTGEFMPVEDPAGLEVVLMYPLAHTARMRVALALGEVWPDDVALADLPAPDEVARGWRIMLEQGTRVVLPDERLDDRVRRARAEVLLASDTPEAVAALEDWGFDAEAEYAWHGLRLRERRAARRRPAPSADGWPDDPAAFLVALRQALVADSDRGVALLAACPADWFGQGIEVHGAPTRHGLVSFAVRWHGARPALLWEVAEPTPGFSVTCPGLDPTWSSTEASGEALLAEPVSPPAAG